jgi:ketosteroid isomerase-like protein
MRSRTGLLAMFSVAGVLTCAGCGSATDANVIRDWAQALRAGDVDKAASYFALPAIVQNGTPPVRITTRAQARAFNELLPCGARLVMTTRHDGYIFATFRLTSRVGGDCGPGIGAIAATAFLIRDGKIAEWRRLPNPGGGQQSPGAPTPGPGQGPAV